MESKLAPCISALRIRSAIALVESASAWVSSGLIPTCMREDKQTQTSHGEVTDLWNEDIVDLMYRVGIYKNQDGKAEPPSRKERPPEKKLFSWVLIVVVFLFSMEWLIRKLLRLA